jgi:DDE superfamily endonuclease
MVDGERESMLPMVVGVDHWQLRQFVTSSTWARVEVGKCLARWVDEFIGLEVCVVDDSGFPRGGADSPGAAGVCAGVLGDVGSVFARLDPRRFSVSAAVGCGADIRSTTDSFGVFRRVSAGVHPISPAVDHQR